MTALRKSRLLACTALCAFALTAVAQAQSPEEVARDGLPTEYVKRIQEHQKNLKSLDSSDQSKGFYSTMVVWPPTYPKLRVCFFSGSQKLRAKVAKVASDWMRPELGIKLDFGKMDDPRKCDAAAGRENQIRVSFDKPGYWSQLGQFAVQYTKQEEASMNFEGFEKFDPDELSDYGIGTIRHEFGHALGLLHEHQSPVGGCDGEYNWDFVYEYLQGPPNNWNKEQIDFNLKPFYGDDLMASDFDKTSVMLYQFPDKYYIKGASSACYVPEPNNNISQVDRAVVAYMYPADAASRQQRFEENKKKFEAIWNAPATEGKKGVMVDMVKAFYGSAGTVNDPDDGN